jgi:hypothetical protein
VASETAGGIQVGKAARNHSLWREVNERRIKLVAETSGDVEFLCECVRMNCTATIRLSMAEYKLIRSSAIRFSVAVGHDFPEFENVVAICDAYAVVEKKGAAAKEAARLDPSLRA